MHHSDHHQALFFAMLVLASPHDARVDTSYLDALPSPEHSTLFCVNSIGSMHASARCMVGEVLEQEGRFRQAVQWATAEIQVRGGLRTTIVLCAQCFCLGFVAPVICEGTTQQERRIKISGISAARALPCR